MRHIEAPLKLLAWLLVIALIMALASRAQAQCVAGQCPTPALASLPQPAARRIQGPAVYRIAAMSWRPVDTRAVTPAYRWYWNGMSWVIERVR